MTLYPKWFQKFIHLSRDADKNRTHDNDFYSLFAKAILDITDEKEKCRYCETEVEARWVSPNRVYIERVHFCKAIDSAIRIRTELVTLRKSEV